MRGFTLVETMVAIAITLVLSTIVLSYNRSSEKQIVLFRDQAVVIGVLNRAKSLAIEKFNSDPNVCAFGVHFDQNLSTFVLFQDLSLGGASEPVFGCRDYAQGTYNSNLRYDGGSELFESFSLDPRLEFGAIPSNGLDILFIPPEINVTSTEVLPVTINIKTKDNSASASITIGQGGQIIL